MAGSGEGSQCGALRCRAVPAMILLIIFFVIEYLDSFTHMKFLNDMEAMPNALVTRTL